MNISNSRFASVFIDEDIILYYTAFKCQDGFVILFNNAKYLFVDKRYFYSAKFTAKAQVVLLESDTLKNFISANKIEKIGLAFPFTNVKFLYDIKALGVEVIDVTDKFVKDSSVKTSSEINYIKNAQNIAEKSYFETLNFIKEGVTEKQVAAYLEYRFTVNGADGKSFDTIVAFGKNASVPHHETDETVLVKNTSVLIDFGCKYKGYCSDMTRTFAFGNVSDDFKKAYSAVLEAHLTAYNNIVAGMTGKQADGIARSVLEKYGYAKYFTHSLGHGVGVKIHEEPRLSQKSEAVLENGNVFSIEPGVYVDGEFGIRIEDTVYLDSGKCVSLNSADKNLFTVNP